MSSITPQQLYAMQVLMNPQMMQMQGYPQGYPQGQPQGQPQKGQMYSPKQTPPPTQQGGVYPSY